MPSSRHSGRGESPLEDLFDYEICNAKYRPIAAALIKKYEELRHIDPDTVLFLLNRKAAGKSSRHKVRLAETSKVPPKWQQVLYQQGGLSYFYLIEFFEKSISCLDENQMKALIYRELRRITLTGKIVAPDVHEWYQILEGLGRHWFYPEATCPDLLADDVDWRRLMGSSYEQPSAED